MMKISFLFFVLMIPFLSGKPVKNAKVFLENGNGRERIAFQQTGDLGKAAFQFLDAGSYRLLLEFPQQEGKWIKEKPRHSTLSKATFNPATKTYYYQAEEGFFAIKISGLKKVDKESFQALFRENRNDEGMQIIISQFQAQNRGAAISVSVKAITSARFKKMTDKAVGDISTISIPGAR